MPQFQTAADKLFQLVDALHSPEFTDLTTFQTAVSERQASEGV